MIHQIKNFFLKTPVIRTEEQNKMLLTEAVGEIIRTRGHSGLTETKIARQARVSQHLICEYFETPEKLVEAYVKKQDYWIEYENRLMEFKEANRGNLLNMVKAIFEYHYRFFDKHKDNHFGSQRRSSFNAECLLGKKGLGHSFF